MSDTSNHSRMNWEQLLCSKRVSEFNPQCEINVVESNYTEVRSPFERDFDQLIYCYPFRRLQDKTQVIPFPEFDFVHTRLTHSLEVASVGRSLGKMAAERIFSELDTGRAAELGLTQNDIGTLVAAACLAHDIGNPPFGHSGESAISLYFLNNWQAFQSAITPKSVHVSDDRTVEFANNPHFMLPDDEYYHEIDNLKRWFDLSQFEGNANGYRIITRNCEKGINPTAALLGAFTKYPRECWMPSYVAPTPEPKPMSKYGFFQSERETFKLMAEELGLIPYPGLREDDLAYCRHPLSFLMEASDDIAYVIIDLEDGCRLHLIDFQKEYGTLKIRDKKGAVTSESINASPIELFIEIASMDRSFDASRNYREMDVKEALAYLRSRVINVLTHECYRIFEANYEGIMSGTFSRSLIDEITDPRIREGISKMKKLVRKFVYNYPPVLQSEASGFEVMNYLIGELAVTSNMCFTCGDIPDARALKLRSLLPDEFSPTDEAEARILTPLEVYNRLMLVLDYVSGMTDNYAMSLYRKIKGISHH